MLCECLIAQLDPLIAEKEEVFRLARWGWDVCEVKSQLNCHRYLRGVRGRAPLTEDAMSVNRRAVRHGAVRHYKGGDGSSFFSMRKVGDLDWEGDVHIRLHPDKKAEMQQWADVLGAILDRPVSLSLAARALICLASVEEDGWDSSTFDDAKRWFARNFADYPTIIH